MKKRIICSISVIIVLIMIFFGAKGLFIHDRPEKRNNKIYSGEAIEIMNNQMVDLYLIACALYFDFHSENLITGANEVEEKTISYFSEYQNHEFIREMDKYVDTINQSYNFSALVPLSIYCLWQGEEIPEHLLTSNIFETREDFDVFWKGINQFYQDTKAKNFFEEQDQYMECFREKIEDNFNKQGLDLFIDEMERYLGNTELYSQENDIDYGILVSLYKVDGASFFHTYSKEDMTYLCCSGIFEDHRVIDSMNIDRIIENAIHEYLHCYINPCVEKETDFIETLYQEQKKSDYAGEMYQGMDWNRIIDENIVRAVSTRIIGRVTQNEEKAYEAIIKREMEFGGFSKVKNIYDILAIYEKNRNQYPTINDYTKKMIEILQVK